MCRSIRYVDGYEMTTSMQQKSGEATKSVSQTSKNSGSTEGEGPYLKTVWIFKAKNGPDGKHLEVGFASRELMDKWIERNVQSGESIGDLTTVWVLGEAYELYSTWPVEVFYE